MLIFTFRAKSFTAVFRTSSSLEFLVSLIASSVVCCSLCTCMPFDQYRTCSLVSLLAIFCCSKLSDYFSHHFLVTYTIYKLFFLCNNTHWLQVLGYPSIPQHSHSVPLTVCNIAIIVLFIILWLNFFHHILLTACHLFCTCLVLQLRGFS